VLATAEHEIKDVKPKPEASPWLWYSECSRPREMGLRAPVECSPATSLSDADFDHFREQAAATGDGAALAACFVDDRRGLAGNRRFIEDCGAFDDFAVARNRLARFHDDDITLAQLFRRNLLGGVAFDAIGSPLHTRTRTGGGCENKVIEFQTEEDHGCSIAFKSNVFRNYGI